MKIAILGPGAIGSIFGSYFAKAGHSISLIGRGKRLAQLREKGLWMHQQGDKNPYKVSGIEVKDALEPNYQYDLVLVTIQRHQIESVIPMLASCSSRYIMLMFNNASGASCWNKELGEERVFWGFPAVLGEIIDGVTYYKIIPGIARFAQITTIGSASGKIDKPLKNLLSLFHDSGLPAVCTRHIDAWLKTHVAFMGPLIAAGYIHKNIRPGFHFSLPEAKLVATAINECFESLQRLEIKPEPLNMRLVRRMPLSLFYPILWLVFASDFSKNALFGHAGHASTEAAELFRELEDLADQTDFQMPAMQKLKSYIESIAQ